MNSSLKPTLSDDDDNDETDFSSQLEALNLSPSSSSDSNTDQLLDMFSMPDKKQTEENKFITLVFCNP